MEKILIEDFNNPYFQVAFKKYFKEFNISLTNKEWVELFDLMNKQKENKAFVLIKENLVIGFIQFRIEKIEHWFFEEKFLFIREFWVDSKFRGRGFGKTLIDYVEKFSINNEIFKIILTTDTAEELYLKLGFIKDLSYKAKNNDDVYVKTII